MCTRKILILNGMSTFFIHIETAHHRGGVIEMGYGICTRAFIFGYKHAGLSRLDGSNIRKRWLLKDEPEDFFISFVWGLISADTFNSFSKDVDRHFLLEHTLYSHGS